MKKGRPVKASDVGGNNVSYYSMCAKVNFVNEKAT